MFCLSVLPLRYGLPELQAVFNAKLRAAAPPIVAAEAPDVGAVVGEACTEGVVLGVNEEWFAAE